MKIATLVLSLLAGIGTGYAAPAPTAALPDCFQSNYDAQLGVFTILNAVQGPVNQQCVLTVGGGGGEGSRFECDAGAPGGHGFIALRAA